MRENDKRDELLEYLTLTLCDRYYVNPEAMHPEAQIAEDLGLDSMDMVGLFNHLEVEFNVEFTNEEVDETQSIQELVDLIESKQQTKQIEESVLVA